MPPVVEAAARVALAYARDQHGFRRHRPLPRYLARNAVFLAAGRRRQLVEAEMGGLHLLLPTTDRTIARSIFAAGGWDPLLVGTTLQALREIGHDVRGSVFLEVGANFGVYALAAVAEMGFGRAVAYEPDPLAHRLLLENIARNGLDGRVTAVNAALSDASGEVMLGLAPGGNGGDNRILAGSGAHGSDGRSTVRVRATTFDEDVHAGTIPLAELGLVWLDVQGHEAQVLAGARSLLEAGVPVVVEFSSSMMGPVAEAWMTDAIGRSYDLLVDLGWCALADRIRFQPADSIVRLASGRRPLETDLLLLKRRRSASHA
jgi:FkbM family methyltransferase